MFKNKKYKLLVAIGLFLLGIVHFWGSVSSIISSEELIWGELWKLVTSRVGIPLYFFFLVIIALLSSYLFHKPKNQNLTTSALQSAEILNGFLSNLETKPIQLSICGLYAGIRKVVEDDGENKYFFQYLLISSLPDNEYRFITYDNFDDREYYVEGSCIRVAENLILKGAISGHRSAVQFSILAYPDHEEKKDIKGIVALSRLDITASLSTRVFFWKVNHVNNVPIHGDPKRCFNETALELNQRHMARVYSEAELIKSAEIKRMLGGKAVLDKAKEYVDSEYALSGVIHS